MVVRSKALAWLAALVIAAGCAEYRPPRLPRGPVRNWFFETTEYRYTLDNGMRVVILPDFTSKVVEVGMRYEVGAIHDPPQKAGLAHLVEHMLFLQRVGGASQPTLAERIGAFAIHYNAYTTVDSTHYSTVAPADRMADLLVIEQQRMSIGCAAIDEDSFQREREVVRNELRLRRSSTGSRVYRRIIEASYPENHPYRAAGADDDTQVSTISYADACSFIRRHYDPSRAILVITGPVLPREVKPLIDRRFGPIPRRRAAPPAPPAPFTMSASRVDLSEDVERTTIYLVWPGRPAYGRERLAEKAMFYQITLAVVAALEKEDLIADFGASEMGGALAPIRVLALKLWSTDDVDRVIELARREADASLAAPWDGLMDLFSLQEHLIALRRFESLTDRSAVFADYVQFDDTGELLDGHLDATRELDGSDVPGAVEGIRISGGPLAIVIRPDPDAATEYGRAPLRYEPHEQPEAAHRRFVDAAEAQRPLELGQPASKLERVRTRTLENGLRVVMLPSHWVPTVQARMVFRAGNAHEPSERGGLAWLAAHLLEVPPEESELTRLLISIGIGSTSSVRSGNDYIELRVDGLEPLAPDLVRALAAWAARGTYDPQALTGLKEGAQRRGVGAAARDVSGAYYAALYGPDHPYARLSTVTAESFARTSIEEVEAFRRTYLVPDNATLIVTGSFDPDAIEKVVHQELTAWRASEPSALAAAPLPARERATYLATDVPDDPLVSFVIGFPVTEPHGAKLAHRRVLEQMLEVRLAVVRERLGASYGVHAHYSTTGSVGALEITGSIDAERAAEGLALLHAELRDLRGGDGAVADFVYARRKVARELAGSLSSLEAAAGQLAYTARYALPTDFFADVARQVASLTIADIERAITEDLNESRAVFMLLGPRAAVDSAYAAIGVAEVQYVE